MRPKDVLTTGEVAKICNVAPRTVSKWFDSGKLRGYRIPGSKDRRIPLDQLVRFMRAHNIPLNGLESGSTRVLIVEADQNVSDLLAAALSRDAGFEVHRARTAFEAGYIASSAKPHVLLLDVALPGIAGRDALRTMKDLPDLATARVVAIADTLAPGAAEGLKQDGFHAALARPFDVPTVVRTIEAVMLEGEGPTSAHIA